MSPEYPRNKSCFGNLELVFPLGSEGLREVTEHCMACDLRVGCLRTAQASLPGRRQLEGERTERETGGALGGVAGFLRRWSKLKRMPEKGDDRGRS